MPEPDLRQAVRTALEPTVSEHGQEWERAGHVPRHVWTYLGSLGLLGLGLPRRWGGCEADLERSTIWLAELGRTGYAGLRTAVAVHSHMASHYLSQHATSELQHQYLPGSATGAKIAALAISEPDAGSDLAALTTQATPEGQGYLLTGTKKTITNAVIADYFVVACRTAATASPRNGISLLVVDSDLPGVSVTPQPTLGWRSAGIGTVTFDRAEVPATHVIGRPGSGFVQLLYGLHHERLIAAAAALGGVELCLELLADRLRTRRVHNTRLADLQSLRHRYAILATETAAARELVRRAARGFDPQQPRIAECAMAKAYTTELACRAADACLQLHGSDGYDEQSTAARLLRDSRAATMAAGPTEVMYDLIAADLLDQPTS